MELAESSGGALDPATVLRDSLRISPFVVKVCGITNAADAMAAVDAGANALGFNFYEKSPRLIAAEAAARISDELPGDVLRVGVFVNASLEQVLSVAGQVNLQVVQLHGEQVPDMALRIWRAVAAGCSLPAHERAPEAYLLDSYSAEYGGSGKSFDWTLSRQYSGRVILAGGLSASNVAGAIRVARPWGVDACSQLESAPGKKDVRQMKKFVSVALEALRAQQATSV